MCDNKKEVWEECCGECKYHQVYYVDFGWFDCDCDNKEAEKINQHSEGDCCGEMIDRNEKFKKCPYFEKANKRRY